MTILRLLKAQYRLLSKGHSSTEECPFLVH
jgi:hypothetical protein